MELVHGDFSYYKYYEYAQGFKKHELTEERIEYIKWNNMSF